MERIATFPLAFIENPEYITFLCDFVKSKKCSLEECYFEDLIKYTHELCHELQDFCIKNKLKFKITNLDKGIFGKGVEFNLFARLPNNVPSPDMPYADLKSCLFKELKKGGFNAKERLTLTNFGDPLKQSNIDTISGKETLQETKYYNKIKRGVIFIFQKDSRLKILGIVFYDLDELFITHPDIAHVFQEDFNKIKKCVLEKKASQRGQTYLHIHPHGCKKSNTRAFGFTPTFLTRLASIYLNVPIVKKGRSYSIDI